MPRTKKVYRLLLRKDWADALLSSISTIHTNDSVAHRLEDAKQELCNAISEAQRTIQGNPLTLTVAAAAAREAGKRGDATVNIDENGAVMLEVTYKSTAKAKEIPSKTPKKISPLPPLGVLRTMAAALNIDISGMGRSKKKILAAIEAKRNESQKDKKIKTAPAITPVTVVTADTNLTNGDLPFSQSEIPDDLLNENTAPPVIEADDVDVNAILKGLPIS